MIAFQLEAETVKDGRGRQWISRAGMLGSYPDMVGSGGWIELVGDLFLRGREVLEIEKSGWFFFIDEARVEWERGMGEEARMLDGK